MTPIIQIHPDDVLKAERLRKLNKPVSLNIIRWEYKGNHFTLNINNRTLVIKLVNAKQLAEWILSQVSPSELNQTELNNQKDVKNGHIHLDNKKGNRQAKPNTRKSKTNTKSSNRTSVRTRQRKVNDNR